MFIYISTDYVFDGKNPPYKIDGKPNPLNKYGMSKLSGETATINASSSNITKIFIYCLHRIKLFKSMKKKQKKIISL